MLKALMMKKRLDETKKALEEIRAKKAGLKTREEELAKAIEEAQTDDETKVVEEEIEKFEAETAEVDEEEKKLEETVESIENELAEAEKEQEKPGAPANEERKKEIPVEKPVERMNMKRKTTRNIFDSLDLQTRTALFEKESTKQWLKGIRDSFSQKRSVENVGLTISEDFLGFLREIIEDNAKLLKYIGYKKVSGTGREVIQGSVYEAVWIECCKNLNELNLDFNEAETDCYLVGGFYKLCKSDIEDSDINLANTVLLAIGQAIAIALDKAILYGRNTDDNYKMPLGVVSRLVQTSKPASYPTAARPWVDLHTTHVLTINSSVVGLALFQTILMDAVVTKTRYTRGEKVWIMNEVTEAYLTAQAMSINANGSLVSGINGKMPIIGGNIETLDFIPDYVIICGHFDLYLLAERGGKEFAQSEHVFFLSNKVAFRGTARYDGLPVIAEAFAVIGVNGVTPNADMSFAADEANTVGYIVLNKSSVSVQATKTVKLTAKLFPEGVEETITWTSSDSTKATVSDGVITGVATGSAVITATCGDAVAVCNVTVTA